MTIFRAIGLTVRRASYFRCIIFRANAGTFAQDACTGGVSRRTFRQERRTVHGASVRYPSWSNAFLFFSNARLSDFRTSPSWSNARFMGYPCIPPHDQCAPLRHPRVAPLYRRAPQRLPRVAHSEQSALGRERAPFSASGTRHSLRAPEFAPVNGDDRAGSQITDGSCVDIVCVTG